MDIELLIQYLYSKPYFEYSVESIIEQGYTKIIICPLFMTEGTDYDVFMERYEELNLASRNIAGVEVLEPFYNANNLAQLYKDEILKNIRKIRRGQWSTINWTS